MWNRKKIRKELDLALDLIEVTEKELPIDRSGGQVPTALALLFIADLIKGEKFYGTCSMKIKGTQVVKPEITNQTFKLNDLYSKLLET